MTSPALRFLRSVLLAATLAVVAAPALPDDEGGGAWRHVVVREVSASTLEARVGETITFEMTVEDVGDPLNASLPARIFANGRVVASRLVSFGIPGEGAEGRLHRVVLDWDTKGFAPGRYKVRGELFLWEDSSPYENRLDLARPVVLHPAGDAISAGSAGKYVETDPRWKPPRALPAPLAR